MPGKYKIVMVRHGESEWNKKNLFCGWFDADLSDKGRQEAVIAGKSLKAAGYTFDIAHTSVLKRAQDTLHSVLKEIDQPDLPVHTTWRLNERHYGGLTGLNKAQTAAKYGEAQVHIWRRSYGVSPPPMEKGHPYHDAIMNDPRYAEDSGYQKPVEFESLKHTVERTLPYWNDVIVPQIKEGKKIIIVAHENSLRGIIKYLDGISDAAIMKLNLPTGIPFLYELNEDMEPMDSMHFIWDGNTVRKAALVAQGKVK